MSPVGQTSRLTSVVEHLRDALVQRGHDHIAEQSIETCQQQSTQHHGDEDLDGGVDVTLARAIGRGKADGVGADGIDGVLDWDSSFSDLDMKKAPGQVLISQAHIHFLLGCKLDLLEADAVAVIELTAAFIV